MKLGKDLLTSKEPKRVQKSIRLTASLDRFLRQQAEQQSTSYNDALCQVLDRCFSDRGGADASRTKRNA